LRRIVTAVQSASRDRARSPLARSEILEESDALLELARQLEASKPVDPMGAALAAVLARGPDGWLAAGDSPGRVHTAVRLAIVTLDDAPTYRPTSDAGSIRVTDSPL
jgi:hypothetical protein